MDIVEANWAVEPLAMILPNTGRRRARREHAMWKLSLRSARRNATMRPTTMPMSSGHQLTMKLDTLIMTCVGTGSSPPNDSKVLLNVGTAKTIITMTTMTATPRTKDG